MNNLAAFIVFLWVTGWSIAALRAVLMGRVNRWPVKGMDMPV